MSRSKFKILISVALLLLSGGGATVAISADLNGEFAAMARCEALRGSVWGAFAVTADGDTLVNVNGGVRMLPASNVKLITTGAALYYLGPDFRFRTCLACDGPVIGGRLKGRLHIIGGGDPSLCDRHKSTGDSLATFTQWLSLVRKAGISSIEGGVVGDAGHFDGEDFLGDWSLEDISLEYSSAALGLNISDNLIDDGSGKACTASAPQHCARQFASFLRDHGITVPEDESGWEGTPDSGGLTVIGGTSSTGLGNLITVANHESENIYAEALFREMGLRVSGSASYEKSAEALGEVLSRMGLGGSLDSVQIVDGSGLSRKNYVSPEFLVAFLTNMGGRPEFGAFLQSIPSPGNGTLKNRLTGKDGSLRARVHMKSGTMNGVRCFSGYILPSDGDSGKMIAFSIMTNNVVAAGSSLASLMDAMVVRLAAEN